MYSGACDIGAYEVGENAFFDFDFDGSDVPGEQANFQIEATNPGYFDLTVDVSSLFPAELTNCSWTCEMEEWHDDYLFRGGPASSCTAGPSSGDIGDFNFVLAGSTLASYDVTCDIPSDVTGTIEARHRGYERRQQCGQHRRGDRAHVRIVLRAGAGSARRFQRVEPGLRRSRVEQVSARTSRGNPIEGVASA